MSKTRKFRKQTSKSRKNKIGGAGFSLFASKNEYEVNDEGDAKSSTATNFGIGGLVLLALLGGAFIYKKH